MISGAEDGAATSNHPLSFRMAAIAFLVQNLIVGTMWGSFGVMLTAVEAKTGASREISALGVSLVTLTIAGFAPVAGILAGKYSLRLLMMAGIALTAAGFALLAITDSITWYLVAYGLLIGPGSSFAAVVLPAALVTRWYSTNCGRALGIVYMPVTIVIVPLVTSLVLSHYGMTATYLMLAALNAVALIPAFFVVDHPPSLVGAEPVSTDAVAARPAVSVADMLRNVPFWQLVLAGASIMSGAVILSTHIVPMAEEWGIDATRAASLLGFTALAGMAGSLIFGWFADKVGGGVSLAILCFNSAILWALLLFQPSFVLAVVIVSLGGLHVASITAVLSMALSERFGQSNFPRAFGLFNLINLPFVVVTAPAAGAVFVHTGSYTYAIIGQITFYALGTLMAVLGSRKRPTTAAPLLEGSTA